MLERASQQGRSGSPRRARKLLFRELEIPAHTNFEEPTFSLPFLRLSPISEADYVAYWVARKSEAKLRATLSFAFSSIVGRSVICDCSDASGMSSGGSSVESMIGLIFV